jgi:O-antigen/teichoic acid export membrane protein
VGKLLGESSLGIYQVAYKISTLPISEITDVVGRVTFPVYVKISTDLPRLRRAFYKTTAGIALLSIFSGIFLFIFGGLIVNIFLGERWNEVIPLLKVLVVFGVIQSIANSTNSLLLARNMQKYVTFSTLVNVIGLGVSIVPLTIVYGLQGAVISPIIGSLLGLPVSLYYVRKCLYK